MPSIGFGRGDERQLEVHWLDPEQWLLESAAMKGFMWGAGSVLGACVRCVGRPSMPGGEVFECFKAMGSLCEDFAPLC